MEYPKSEKCPDYIAILDSLKKYKFVGADDQLTKKLMDFGTRQSADHHVTWIFKRLRKDPCDDLPFYSYLWFADHFGVHDPSHIIPWIKRLFVGDNTIGSTHYGPEGEPAPTLSELKLQCIASYAEDYLKPYGNLQEIRSVLLIFLMFLLVHGGMALTP